MSRSRPRLNDERLVAHTVEEDKEFQAEIHLIANDFFLTSVLVTGEKNFVTVPPGTFLRGLLE